ncbi:MAG TPA: FAD-binding oxidoreductase [Acidimicrobiales bacterium]|nr:FAD-binding oxidoreductase [Acidimicrobiales bacterium]
MTPADPPPLGPGAPTPVVALPEAPVLRFPPVAVAGDALLARLRGACEVVTDERDRLEASRDWWPLTATWATGGEVPAEAAAVARPASSGEVAEVLRACDDAGVPVTVTAGRSGVCGASVPVFGGIALDLTRLTGIEAYDDTSLLVDVAAGTFGDLFEADLRARGATLGHWPQSIALSTVGGWVACRSAGQYSTRYGKIEDLVAGLEVVLADGTVLRCGGRAPRSATGPDLTQLFTGSEGTLGVVTSVRLRASALPGDERRGAWGFATFADGLDACRRVLRRGATPAVLRLYDQRESQRSFDVDTNVLIALDEGDPVAIDGGWRVVTDECGAGDPLDASLVGRWLDRRNHVADLGDLAGAGIVADTVEIAAPWSALPAIYEAALAAVRALPDALAASAHQSHAYRDGACLYFTVAGRPGRGPGGEPADVAAREGWYRAAWDAVTTATLDHGGALSHHHGVGLNRSRFMAAALDGGLPVLARVKAALDPNGILNPGKLGLDSPWGPPPWPAR